MRNRTHEMFAHRFGPPTWERGRYCVWATDHYVFGDHASLLKFKEESARSSVGNNPAGAFRGWHSHHVIEAVDLESMGLDGAGSSRMYDDLPAVLIPESAHHRVTSVLSRGRTTMTTSEDLDETYHDAYEHVIGLPAAELHQVVHDMACNDFIRKGSESAATETESAGGEED